MSRVNCGHSYGDAIIFLIAFAEQDPGKFLETILPVLLLVLVGTLISLYAAKKIFGDPVKQKAVEMLNAFAKNTPKPD